jgi:hypothetical protein
MTKQNGPRYSDSKDFNESHDSIVIGISDEAQYIAGDMIARKLQLRKLGLDNFSYADRETSVSIEKAIDPHNIPDLIISDKGSLRYTGPLPVMNLPDKQSNNEKRWVIACPFCHEIYRSVIINGDIIPLGTAVHKEEMINRASELGILGKNGLTKLCNNDKHICAEPDLRIIIEVKSYVKSFGETMRQLQSYKDAAQKKWGILVESIICIASPDDRFSQEFEKQGFYFMHREALVSGDKPKENKDLSSFFHQEEDVTE